MSTEKKVSIYDYGNWTEDKARYTIEELRTEIEDYINRLDDGRLKSAKIGYGEGEELGGGIDRLEVNFTILGGKDHKKRELVDLVESVLDSKS